MFDVFNSDVSVVVFDHGFCGSFLSRVLYGLSTRDYEDVVISELGDCHRGKRRADTLGLRELDILTPYTTNWEDMSDNDRLTYLRQLVKNNGHCQQCEFQIVPSHQFKHIELYRKLFPKCKILAVTHTSEESVIGELNGIIKFGLSFDNKISNQHRDNEFNRARLYLSERTGLGLEKVNQIVDDLSSAATRTLMLWAFIKSKPIEEFNGGGNESIEFFKSSIPARLVDNIDGVIEFPFSIIRYGDSNGFVSKIQEMFCHQLNDDEQHFIKRNFDRYYQKQNKAVLNNPINFLINLESQALDFLEEITIKGETQ